MNNEEKRELLLEYERYKLRRTGLSDKIAESALPMIYHFLSSLPEEKEENDVDKHCEICKYSKGDTWHDQMWCRDCSQGSHFAAF